MQGAERRTVDPPENEVSLTTGVGPAEPITTEAGRQKPARAANLDPIISAKALAPVSAIIPTRNRPDDLRRTVRTLLDQTTPPRQVVIVDQSADDRSYRAVQAEFADAARRLPIVPELKYIHDPSIKGVSAARNHSMGVAAQAIWLFLDDDIVMESEFIAELIRVYDTEADVDGVSGVITNYIPMPILHRVWMAAFARGPFRDKRLAVYWRANRLRNAGLFRVAGFSGGLMSFRHEVARGGAFDIRIGDGEDVDFCLNLGKDRKFVISPRARLQHLSSPVSRSREEPLWIERYAITQSFLYHKHWRGGLLNAMWYGWLCVGLGIATTGSAVRRSSSEPWRALIAGIRSGRNTARL